MVLKIWLTLDPLSDIIIKVPLDGVENIDDIKSAILKKLPRTFNNLENRDINLTLLHNTEQLLLNNNLLQQHYGSKLKILVTGK